MSVCEKCRKPKHSNRGNLCMSCSRRRNRKPYNITALTIKQRAIYDYIVSFAKNNLFAPSLEEVAMNFKVVKNAARKQVCAIEKKGYLKRVGHRAIRILK